jgi:hypothetical protein
MLAHQLSRERDVDRPARSLPKQAAGGRGVVTQSVPPHNSYPILIEVDDDGRETVLGPVTSGPDENDCLEDADEDEEAEVERMLKGRTPSS